MLHTPLFERVEKRLSVDGSPIRGGREALVAVRLGDVLHEQHGLVAREHPVFARAGVHRLQDVGDDFLIVAVFLQVDLVEHELHVTVLLRGAYLKNAALDRARLEHRDNRECNHQDSNERKHFRHDVAHGIVRPTGHRRLPPLEQRPGLCSSWDSSRRGRGVGRQRERRACRAGRLGSRRLRRTAFSCATRCRCRCC